MKRIIIPRKMIDVNLRVLFFFLELVMNFKTNALRRWPRQLYTLIINMFPEYIKSIVGW